MVKQKGFTLIELLAVISIIALLMAIMMPAMAATRQQANAVFCQSTLSQWGKVFALYTIENDGYFASGNTGKMWTTFLRPYYNDPELLLCPIATKPASQELGVYNANGTKFLAWGEFKDDPNDPYSTYTRLELIGVYGSYGMNGHVSNDPPGTVDPYGRDLSNTWRHCNVRGASNIPLFLDCITLGAMPKSTNEPPRFDGDSYYDTGMPDMKAFCIDRHRGNINALFVDSSVQKVGLKQLWKLKWHKEFNTNAEPPTWPEWMSKFRDY